MFWKDYYFSLQAKATQRIIKYLFRLNSTQKLLKLSNLKYSKILEE